MAAQAVVQGCCAKLCLPCSGNFCPASPTVRLLLLLLASSLLLKSSNGQTVEVSSELLAALVRTQLHSDRGGASALATGNPLIPDREQNDADVKAAVNLPIAVSRDARLVAPGSTLHPHGGTFATSNGVDLRALPSHPIVLYDSAQLEIEGLTITGLRPCPGSRESLGALIAARLLHPASHGTLAFKDVVFDLDVCYCDQFESRQAQPVGGSASYLLRGHTPQPLKSGAGPNVYSLNFHEAVMDGTVRVRIEASILRCDAAVPGSLPDKLPAVDKLAASNTNTNTAHAAGDASATPSSGDSGSDRLEAGDVSGSSSSSSSRRLLAAVSGGPGVVVLRHGKGKAGVESAGLGGGSGFAALQVILVAMVVLVAVGGMWLQRLFSCACMSPPPPTLPPLDSTSRTQTPVQPNGRSFQKTSGAIARISQNHTLSALSRFSAQLRKGDDVSVRDGSVRHGSVILRHAAGDDSVRGGGSRLQHSVSAATAAVVVAAAPPPPPPLLTDLSELKAAGQGRLATSLHGIWQQQHRVLIKVLTHGEDCSFMLEQVGEVWSRLSHPNVVSCLAAGTFEVATCVAALPDLTELLPTPTDPSLALQTWIVLERCENGSLATVLAQRYHQHQGRKAGSGGGAASALLLSGSDPAVKDGSAARHVARKLGRFSRGRRKSSGPGLREAAPPPPPAASAPGGAPAGAIANVAVEIGGGGDRSQPEQQQQGPPPAPTSIAAPVIGRVSGGQEDSGPAAGVVTAMATVVTTTAVAPKAKRQPKKNEGVGNSGSASGSAAGSGAEDNNGDSNGPGLLPVTEVLSIAHDIASGLEYLHSLDLCHGDLRAENVMVQTVVLPSNARVCTNGAPGSGDSGGADGAAAVRCANADSCGVAAALDVAGLPYANGGATSEPGLVGVDDMSVGGTGGRRVLDEGLAAVYASNGGQSDVMDMSGVNAGAGGGGGTAAMPCGGAAGERRLCNMASYGNTTNGSCGVPDCCTGHPWSNSLRQSNGYMTSSTFSTATNTMVLPPHPAGGGGGGGGSTIGTVGLRGVDDHASMDDRTVAGSLQSTAVGSYSSQWLGAVRPGLTSYGVNGGSRLQLCGANGAASSQTGNIPTSATGMNGDGTTAAAQMPCSLSTSAVAALSRGIGLACGPMPRQSSLAAAAASGTVAPSAAVSEAAGLHSPTLAGAQRQGPFPRRQSNTSLAAALNTSSGNDVPTMSKAQSGLTAWPESPHEGRGHGDGPTGHSGGAPNASPSSNGGGGTAATSLTNGYCGSCTSSSQFSRCPTAGGTMGQSVTRRPVIGGLRSALTAPDPAVLAPKPSPPAAALSPVAAASAESTSAFAASQVQRSMTEPPYTPALSSDVAAPARLGSDAADGALTSAASRAMSPRVVTLQLDSSPAPSPLASPRTVGDCPPPSSSGPSTPSGRPAAVSSSGGGGGGRSRSAVGVVCTIAGHSHRRCSAPPVVALPIIRRVAKLTDPWVSLARMPTDCAGGPWSPEAAAAIGATSGADVSHLPPELLLSGRLHPSSDVYSLGILMWRMLSPTGEAPYTKLHPAEVAYKVVACGMRPAFSPAVPEALRRLVEDCWQSDPTARPTVQQVIQRLAELQPHAGAMQRQWRDRHTLFGVVSTVPISAVAVLPLQGEQNDVAARWAEVAGIRLLRASNSFGMGSIAGLAGRVELSTQASFGRNSSRGQSGTFTMPSYPSLGASNSAAHLYQQPPPPTPPAGNMTRPASQFTTAELSNHSNAVSEPPTHGSQSNHQPTSPYTGHLAVQPYKVKRSGMDGF